MRLDESLTLAGERALSLQFYCGCLPIAFLVDQRKLLFWKKMMTSNNALLMIFSAFACTVL